MISWVSLYIQRHDQLDKPGLLLRVTKYLKDSDKKVLFSEFNANISAKLKAFYKLSGIHIHSLSSYLKSKASACPI